MEERHIKNSGNNTVYETGAKREVREGKGRCDLLTLDVLDEYMDDDILYNFHCFINTGDTVHLFHNLKRFADKHQWDDPTMILEVSKHFEEGSKIYGEWNWQKGLLVKDYVSSAIRHYLKWLRGDKDEPHDRAFVWNILCCIWTCNHKPELNDYAKKEGGNNEEAV